MVEWTTGASCAIIKRGGPIGLAAAAPSAECPVNHMFDSSQFMEESLVAKGAVPQLDITGIITGKTSSTFLQTSECQPCMRWQVRFSSAASWTD